jgi:hypothetical protein
MHKDFVIGVRDRQARAFVIMGWAAGGISELAYFLEFWKV